MKKFSRLQKKAAGVPVENLLNDLSQKGLDASAEGEKITVRNGNIEDFAEVLKKYRMLDEYGFFLYGGFQSDGTVLISNEEVKDAEVLFTYSYNGYVDVDYTADELFNHQSIQLKRLASNFNKVFANLGNCVFAFQDTEIEFFELSRMINPS
ncbi:gp56 [Bacillus phage G]|uniref:Gp56 n=1 Tax=Bacillus phage G TaxID=2884420 RepID=G3MBC6_9CAUD|nr:gp56 [Bacillus phage G]AEO93327.1 gp56 [Bacillus phage G]